MKKLKSILLLLHVFAAMTCFAQVELLSKEVVQQQMQISLAKDSLGVPVTEQSAISSTVIISRTALVDKDFIIHLTNKPFKNGAYFTVNLAVQLNGQALPIEPENLFGDVNKKISFTDASQTHQIIWTNLMETYIDLNGALTINLTIDIYGKRELPYNVDCGIEPTFTTKQKIPFLIAGIVGAGAVATGQYLKNESEKDYANYLIQETYDEGEPFYQDANQKANNGQILTYTGITVLTVDAIWFFIRQRRFRKQRDVYNEFCNPKKITLQPYFEAPRGNGSLNSSLKLTYTF